MSRAEQAQGKAGETAARLALQSLGYRAIEKIGTPVRLIPHPSARGYYRVIYGEPVAADWSAVGPGGVSVRVEVKTTDHNLRWSDFRQHQPGKLSEHEDAGGVSLVVWVTGLSVLVMRWREVLAAGFGPGKSLTVAQALQIVELP